VRRTLAVVVMRTMAMMKTTMTGRRDVPML
jgi:hypothetical protein